MLVGYGEGDRLSHHVVLTPNQLVREAPGAMPTIVIP